MMKKALFLIGFFLFCTHFLISQETVQWRGPARDGKYPETGLMKSWPENGPDLLWHFDELGEGHGSATVTRDLIYTAGSLDGKGYIFCFTLEGKLLWKVYYGEEWTESWPGARSTPLFSGGKLYIMSGFGKLVCMNASDGKKIWIVDLLNDYDGQNIQWGLTENLLINGDKLFCTPGGLKNNVIALDRNTGKLIWSCAGNGEKSAYCSPCLIKLPKRTILVTHTENSILGIDAENGKLLWRHPQTNRYSVHANTPYFQNGYLYCVSGYGTGGVQLKISEDGTVKQEIWRNTSLDSKMGGFIVLDDVIYGSDDSNKAWYAVDWKTGNNIHAEKILGKGVVIYSDGMLYCYSDAGEMALVKPTLNGFQKVSSFQVFFGEAQHWAHPVIKDGKLYIRHGNSLMVYDIRQK